MTAFFSGFLTALRVFFCSRYRPTAIGSMAAALPGSTLLSQDTGGILKSKPDGMENLGLQKQVKCALFLFWCRTTPQV